jgi:hypothetical protein
MQSTLNFLPVFLSLCATTASALDMQPKKKPSGPTPIATKDDYVIHQFYGSVREEIPETFRHAASPGQTHLTLVTPGIVYSHTNRKTGSMTWLASSGTFQLSDGKRTSYVLRRFAGVLQDKERLYVLMYDSGLMGDKEHPPKPAQESSYTLHVFLKANGEAIFQASFGKDRAVFPLIEITDPGDLRLDSDKGRLDVLGERFLISADGKIVREKSK